MMEVEDIEGLSTNNIMLPLDLCGVKKAVSFNAFLSLRRSDLGHERKVTWVLQ